MDLSSILSVAGGVAGNMALPGIGGAIGSSAGKALGGAISKKNGSSGSGGGDSAAGLAAGMGLLQQIQATRLKNKADSAFPDFVDPNQSAFLAELAQKRKSMETGSDFAAGMNEINSTNAGTNDAITKVTGGDAGATVQALLQSERAAGDSKNAVLAQGEQQQAQNNVLYSQMLNQISARKMQLQLARSQQFRGEWAKKQQTANQNLMAGVSRAASGGQMGNTMDPGTLAPGMMQPGYADVLKLKKDVGTINQTPIDNASLTLPGNIA